jgi:hypothetical protein
MSKEIEPTKNILDLSNIDSRDLMLELKSRGYYTDLIFGIGDVDFQLDSFNSDREDEEGKQIVLSKDEKMTILENCFNTDWYCEQMNSDIYNDITNHYDSEEYYKKIDN